MRKSLLILIGISLLFAACSGVSTTVVPDQQTVSGRIAVGDRMVIKYFAGDELVKTLFVAPDGTVSWQPGESTATPTAVSVWVERGGTLAPYVSSYPMHQQASGQEFIIGPGDVLSINVWKNSELTREVPVRPDGRITLPLLGDIPAAGMTADELKGVLEKAFVKYISNPEVTVIVAQVNSYKIFVQGMVTNPGTYPISGRTTLVQAISLAGGFTEFADRGAIIILRNVAGGSQRIKVNYNDIVDGDQPDVPLQPGDTIVIP
ncbi:MAG TPA: polysaccharide biosynthesis/export family protein [bacterium]|nr:polysaccharide biosynthesis/export family protein [bacterium]